VSVSGKLLLLLMLSLLLVLQCVLHCANNNHFECSQLCTYQYYCYYQFLYGRAGCLYGLVALQRELSSNTSSSSSSSSTGNQHASSHSSHSSHSRSSSSSSSSCTTVVPLNSIAAVARAIVNSGRQYVREGRLQRRGQLPVSCKTVTLLSVTVVHCSQTN
jgi:hypothetical protein